MATAKRQGPNPKSVVFRSEGVLDLEQSLADKDGRANLDTIEGLCRKAQRDEPQKAQHVLRLAQLVRTMRMLNTDTKKDEDT